MTPPGSLPGRVLAIDHGARRVGLAISDPLRLSASALVVVARHEAVDRIAQIIAEREVTEIVLGMPVTLAGKEGQAAQAVREFARELAAAVTVPITLVDERYSTATAERVMVEAGTKRQRRRQSIDKVAATVILRSFLDRGR